MRWVCALLIDLMDRTWSPEVAITYDVSQLVEGVAGNVVCKTTRTSPRCFVGFRIVANERWWYS
ncbi:MAG: hypothetical protein H5T64_13180 [Chloroflexi bacterium]|nr:hypothetical protein [Chloroflexota bacterium]